MPYKVSRIIFAVLFLAVLLSLAAYNAVSGFEPLKTALTEFSPDSPVEIKREISTFEAQLNENMAWRYNFIEGYAYLHTILGSNTSEMNFAKAKDGGIFSVILYPDDQIVLTQNYARRIRELKNYTAGSGTKVIYVQPPEKYIRGYTEASYGLPLMNRSTKMDAILYHLHSYGVDYIDLRQTLPTHNIPYVKWFYKTDHHWTSELAFAAFVDIVTYLDDNYSANLDPSGFYRNSNNYSSVNYPESFLGAHGRNTGVNYSRLDDFTAVFPKFENRYQVSGKVDEIEKQGTSFKTIYDPYWMRIMDDTYLNYRYNFYMTGIRQYIRVKNMENPDAPKLLLIGDSMAQPLIAFLSPLFSEIELIWPLAKESGQYEINIDTWLESNLYDYVIIEVFPDNIMDSMFNFFRSADMSEPLLETDNE